uniref:Follistatin-like 1b n=1 Tax=Sinocyclocheilus grahami TaxID=75366 RepID=A0A672RK35_SINGR
MFRCLPVFFLLAVVCCYAEVSYVKPAFIKKKSWSFKKCLWGSGSQLAHNELTALVYGLAIVNWTQLNGRPHCYMVMILVCYVADRNELRRRVIDWLQTEVVPDGWFTKGSNFTDILLKYFKNYDNGDSQLDSAELLKFIQHNETAVQMNSYAEEENNRLLRSLCVDALVELSDENADWKLSFDEFLSCLKPGFNPPEKKCALEDETYEDGAETQVECNICVCACGNWVCTAMTCDEKSPVIDTNGDQEMTEEEWTRRVAELNKHQVSCLISFTAN